MLQTQNNKTTRRSAGILTCPNARQLAVLLGAIVAGAAQAADPVPTPPVTTQGFLIVPSASISATWDDNIYGTPNAALNDLMTTLAASLKANSKWTRHRLALNAGVSADRYADHDVEDVTDWWLGGDGRHDLSAQSHALGGLRFSRDHEDRSSPDSASGAAEPTAYLTSQAHLGFAHQLGPFTIRLGGVFEKLDFDEGSTPAFDIDQRDRTQYSVGTRFSYRLKPDREVFFQAATDTREYEDNTVGRDSDGYRLGLGLRVKHGANLEAEGFLGHLAQEYDDVALKDVSAAYYGANLKWVPQPQTRLNAELDRSVNETTYTGASSHLDTKVSARVEHDLTTQLALNAGISYANSDYQGVGLELDEYSASVGARYYFTKNVFVAGGYRHSTRDASLPAYEYDRNVFFLTLGYTPRSH